MRNSDLNLLPPPTPTTTSPQPPSYSEIVTANSSRLTYREHLEYLASKYQICWTYLNRLEKLTFFRRILLVLDDSTSMTARVENSPLKTNQTQVLISL